MKVKTIKYKGLNKRVIINYSHEKNVFVIQFKRLIQKGEDPQKVDALTAMTEIKGKIVITTIKLSPEAAGYLAAGIFTMFKEEIKLPIQ